MQEKNEKKLNGSEDPEKGLKSLKEILAKRKKKKKVAKANLGKKLSLGNL